VLSVVLTCATHRQKAPRLDASHGNWSPMTRPPRAATACRRLVGLFAGLGIEGAVSACEDGLVVDGRYYSLFEASELFSAECRRRDVSRKEVSVLLKSLGVGKTVIAGVLRVDEETLHGW